MYNNIYNKILLKVFYNILGKKYIFLFKKDDFDLCHERLFFGIFIIIILQY